MWVQVGKHHSPVLKVSPMVEIWRDDGVRSIWPNHLGECDAILWVNDCRGKWKCALGVVWKVLFGHQFVSHPHKTTLDSWQYCCSSLICRFCYLQSMVVCKQSSSDSQKINSSPILHDNAYILHFISSHHIDILLSHINIRRVSTIQNDILREGDHIHKLLL